jgi:hypothetical protein
MSCAGLDAALKQAIRDCLENLLEGDPQVREGFERFIRKRISGETGVAEGVGGAKFLAAVLVEREPRNRLVEEYIKELTGDSLQSADEIMRTASALGLDAKSLGLDPGKLREIFSIRNKIIHELDIDLNAKPRKRKIRSQTDLLDNSDFILKASVTVIEAIDKKVTSAPTTP